MKTDADKRELPRFIDTHCHIDLYQDPKGTLKKAEDHGVGVIAVTNTPSVFEHTTTLTADTRHAQAALGLHPELVEERASELGLMWRLFDRTRFIGEVGLDYTDSRQAIRHRQREIFGKILERCETSANKVLTVHSRRAAADVVSAIGDRFRGTVILHWYSGSKKVLEQAIENGLYFSINSAMLKSKRGEEIIRVIPQDRVLTETDGPFVSIGRSPASPLNIPEVITMLSRLWKGDEDTTIKIVMDNYVRCTGLDYTTK